MSATEAVKAWTDATVIIGDAIINWAMPDERKSFESPLKVTN